MRWDKLIGISEIINGLSDIKKSPNKTTNKHLEGRNSQIRCPRRPEATEVCESVLEEMKESEVGVKREVLSYLKVFVRGVIMLSSKKTCWTVDQPPGPQNVLSLDTCHCG